MLNSWPHTGWADEYNKAAARKDYKGKTDEELHDIAYSEVVAQCCETLLSDTDAVSRLASQIKAENKTLWDKICEFFRNLAEALKNAYEGLAPGSEIANQAKDTIQKVERLRDLWASAGAGAIKNYTSSGKVGNDGNGNAQSMEASKNLRDADRQKNTTNEGGVQHQERANGSFTPAEIQAIQSIGRKSINSFTPADISETEKFAQRYWKEMRQKSPFFRAWFGDWRVNDQTPIQVANRKGDTRGIQHNDDTGWDIQVSRIVFNETSAHKKVQNVSARKYLPYINDIVQNAVLLDSYGIDNRKSPNTLLMHSLYAVADVGSGPELIKLYVEEMNNPNSSDTGKRAYQLQNIESQQLSANGSGSSLATSISTADIQSVSDLFAAVKQHDINFTPNVASKVVNADGTPKVVYHQTGRDFTVFDNSTPVAGKNDSETPNGFFFKDNDHDIGLGGSKQMAVYLDMKNPLHFANRQEANNWYCKNISGYADLQKEMSDALSPISDEMDSIENEMFSDEVTDDQYDILDQKWNELLDKMKSVEDGYRGRLRKLLDDYFINGKSGYDGIMLDYDGHRYVNGERENVKTYIVFNRTQIKSATDNIGTFDGSNPDIRYSDRDDGGMSNRQLLANAIESSVQHEAEAKRPAAYNGNDMQAD